MAGLQHIKKGALHAPHAPLPGYYGSEAERSGWVRAMFNRTAPDYNRIERWLGLGTGSWYRRQALLRAGLQYGSRVVDVGVGTGLVARQAAVLVGDPARVAGVDPSPGMLENAKVPQGVVLVAGSAEQIPFPDNHFDFLSMGYALRHIGDLPHAFAEFYRVLKPGGRFCLLEITCPEQRLHKMLLKAYLRGVVPALAGLATGSRETAKLWRYYWDTIEACVLPAQVMQALRDAGFGEVDRHCELGVFSEYRGMKPVPAATASSPSVGLVAIPSPATENP